MQNETVYKTKQNGTKVAFLENAVDRRHNFGVANWA